MSDENKVPNSEGHEPEIKFSINDVIHDSRHQFLKGHQLKTIGKIPSHDMLYLIIHEPWRNELIENDKEVDLALRLPEIEHFYSKPAHTIILIVKSSAGDLPTKAYSTTTKIIDLIQLVIKDFGFDPNGNYKMRIEGSSENLKSEETIHEQKLKDFTVLVFTDLGKGA